MSGRGHCGTPSAWPCVLARGRPDMATLLPNAGERTAGEPLAGRVALVTGGGGGLGEALCHMLAAGGARVVVADVRLDAAERVVDGLGGTAQALRVDVGDAALVARAVHSVVAACGALDILINNAGVDLTVPF